MSRCSKTHALLSHSFLCDDLYPAQFGCYRLGAPQFSPDFEPNLCEQIAFARRLAHAIAFWKYRKSALLRNDNKSNLRLVLLRHEPFDRQMF